MRNPNHSSRAGFTMIELLIVIGILVLLAALLMPTLATAYRSAGMQRTRADLAAISTALDAYRDAFKDYPRTVTMVGAVKDHVLAKALIAPGPAAVDGADGAGFRVQPNGKLWGPFLPADKFKAAVVGSQLELLDRFGKPIEYYPLWNRTSGVITAAATTARYDQRDGALVPAVLQYYLGADPSQPYLLVSPGEDGVFPTDATAAKKSDDVRNFE